MHNDSICERLENAIRQLRNSPGGNESSDDRATALRGVVEDVLDDALTACRQAAQPRADDRAPSGESEAREALHDRDTLIRAILQTAVEGIITIDGHGLIESFNPAAERIFGYSADEVRGRNVRLLMPAPYHDEHDGYIEHYLRTGERKIIGIGREVEGLRKDGSRFPMDLSVSQVRQGERRMFTGFVRDISDRKLLEAELREERDFAESLIHSAQAIVLVLDLEGQIVRFNRFMEELTGYRLDEVRGRDWFETFLPARTREELRRVHADTIDSADRSSAVNPILTRDGREREIAWSNTPLKDAAGHTTGVLAVGSDISDLHEAQQRVVQVERLAAIGEMVTGLAHESRNALQRIQACAEMLELEVEENAEALDLVQRIQNAEDQLLRLFDEVRGYAAPIALELERENLAEVWREAWQLVAPLRAGRQAVLRERVEGVDLACRVDRFRLVQVFRNLLENALAACADPVQVEIECAPTHTDDGLPALRIAVRDNGPGLSPEQRECIFQPFYTTRTQGTGLGMAIAQRIVDAHGGRLSVGGERPRSGTLCAEGASGGGAAAAPANAAAADLNATPGAEIVLILPREPA